MTREYTAFLQIGPNGPAGRIRMDEFKENQNTPENEGVPENEAAPENQSVPENEAAPENQSAPEKEAAPENQSVPVTEAPDPGAGENGSQQGSVYSYSYKDLSRGSREGNYNVRRDSNESIFEESETSADSDWGSGSGVYGARNSAASGGVYGSRSAQNSDNSQGADRNNAQQNEGGQSQGQGQSGSYNTGQNQGQGQSGSYNAGQNQNQGQRGSYNAGGQNQGQNRFGGSRNGRGSEDGGQNQKYSYRPNSDGNYRDVEPERKERKEYKRPKRRPGLRSGGGFGQTLVKCLCLAIIFGLVAGGIMYGMNRRSLLAIRQAVIEQQNAASEAQKNSASQEGADGESGSASETKELPPAATDGEAASIVALDLTEMVEDVMPSVVSISNVSEQENYEFFGRSQV